MPEGILTARYGMGWWGVMEWACATIMDGDFWLFVEHTIWQELTHYFNLETKTRPHAGAPGLGIGTYLTISSWDRGMCSWTEPWGELMGVPTTERYAINWAWDLVQNPDWMPLTKGWMYPKSWTSTHGRSSKQPGVLLRNRLHWGRGNWCSTYKWMGQNISNNDGVCWTGARQEDKETQGLVSRPKGRHNTDAIFHKELNIFEACITREPCSASRSQIRTAERTEANEGVVVVPAYWGDIGLCWRRHPAGFLKGVYEANHNAFCPVRSADGRTIITNKTEILSRWAEHYRDLLNRYTWTDPNFAE